MSSGYHRSVHRFLVVVLGCAGCFDASLTPCGTLSCATTQVCSADQTCVSPDQIAACANVADGAKCTFGAAVGFCHHGTCVTELDTCGDGVARLALDELCDCGSPDLLASPPPGCTGFNSNAPTATCRPDCQRARCGDGIVDTSELCDDGNTLSGDGCRADCQGRFEKLQTPTGIDLLAVVTTDATNAYAFGFQGTAMHYDGVGWTALDLGTTDTLWVAWANGPDEIYVLGSAPPVGTAALFRFDGTTWIKTNPGFSGQVGGVWASSPADIYVALSEGSLFHFNGTTWSAVTTACTVTLSSFAGVVGTSPSNIYFGTDGGLCRFDGSGWSKIDTTGIGHLARTPTGDVVALSSPPQLRRWTGATGGPAIPIPGTAIAVAAVSSTEILVVSTNGLVLSLDDTTWTHLATPTEVSLEAVAATDPTNVFIVGISGTVLH
jgi:cysteine-rich repeat protein